MVSLHFTSYRLIRLELFLHSNKTRSHSTITSHWMHQVERINECGSRVSGVNMNNCSIESTSQRKSCGSLSFRSFHVYIYFLHHSRWNWFVFNFTIYSQTHKKCVSIILQRYSMTCYYFERFQVLWMDVNDQSCSKTVDRMTEQKNCVWRTEPFYTSCESSQNKKKLFHLGRWQHGKLMLHCVCKHCSGNTFAFIICVLKLHLHINCVQLQWFILFTEVHIRYPEWVNAQQHTSKKLIILPHIVCCSIVSVHSSVSSKKTHFCVQKSSIFALHQN